MKRMGRIGVKAILYFEIVTTLALFLGLAAVNLVRPGAGVRFTRSAAEAAMPQAQTTFKLGSRAHLSHQHHRRHGAQRRAADRGLRLPVRRRLRGHRRQSANRWSKFCGSLAEVMFRYTKYVMYLAPLGVGAAIAVTIGNKGVGVLFGLGKLIATMYVARSLFVVLVLGAGARSVPHSARRVLSRRARAVPDRLLHRLERSRAAAGARKHGAVRRAQAHRGFRDSHRLQLQPGGQHALSVAGRGLRGAGGRRAPLLRRSSCS